MLRVSHNNAGSYPDWHLEKVQTYLTHMPEAMTPVGSRPLLNIKLIHLLHLLTYILTAGEQHSNIIVPAFPCML